MNLLESPLRSLGGTLKLICLTAVVTLAGCRRPGFPGYPDGFRDFAYVANSGANTVTVLDLVYLRPDRTLEVGGNPSALVQNPVKPEIYVVNSQTAAGNGSVSVIDAATNEVVATIPVRRNPVALSVDPTGHRAYVANAASNSISVLDLDARRTIGVFSTSVHPTSALVAPDGRTLVVTHPDSGSISVFEAGAVELDPKNPQVPGPPLRLRSSFSGCAGAVSPVILPDSSKVFLACPGTNQVMAISLAAAPDSWAAKQNPSLRTDAALAMLDVGKNPTQLTLKPDGGEVFCSNTDSGSISEISTYTNEVGNTFPIGDRPRHAAISDDNGALWVSIGGGDAISLYSIDDGKLLTNIHVGSGPDALAFSNDKEQRMLVVADRSSGDVAVVRTNGGRGPALFTMMPAGAEPSAVLVVGSRAKD